MKVSCEIGDTRTVQRPPLQEIATMADVSVPTVSRVINGRPGVAKATRKRVVAALESLGFTDITEPQPVRRNVVAVISGEFTNPVFPTLVDQISRRLTQEGYLTATYVPDTVINPEERCVEEVLAIEAAAAIFIGGSHAEVDGSTAVYQPLLARGVPLVLVNGRTPNVTASHIFCNEESGSYQAVNHLLSLGHTSIGCAVGGTRYAPTRRLIAGYKRAMQQADLDCPDGNIVETSFTVEGGRAASRRLLESGVTAIVASNDLMALGAIYAAEALGLAVPEDASVVGYDGTDFTSYTSPSLTTLRQPFAEMAELIVKAVTAGIHQDTSYHDRFVFEPRLIVRGSTGVAPSVALRR